jgi:hypothetical protein
VFRVSGCKPRCSGFVSQLYQVLGVAVGLKRVSLGLVRINEELIERKVMAPV